MKGKAAKDLFLKTCKDLKVTEKTCILLAAFYNSGKWRNVVDGELIEDLLKDYEDGIIDSMVLDFCLDVKSGRLPPNWMVNKFEQMKIISPKKDKG